MEITASIIERARKHILTQNLIITSRLPFLQSMLKRYDYRLRDDLLQEGVFGIIDAINTFDPSLAAFNTHVFNKVRNKLSAFITKNNNRPLCISNLSAIPENDTPQHHLIDLKEALVKLPIDQQILIKTYYSGNSLKDIQQLYNIQEEKTMEYVRLWKKKVEKRIRGRIMDEIIINYNPVQSQIVGNLPEEVVDELFETLSFNPQGYAFSDKYIEGKWDGVQRLFSKRTLKFRSGLIFKVSEILQKNDVQFVMRATHLNPLNGNSIHITPGTLDNYRPYQKEAIEAVLKYKRGGLNLPPRTGKTIIAAGILKVIKSTPSIFLVFSLEIAIQTIKKFEHWLKQPIGFIGDGQCNIQPITVCSMQSLLSAYNQKWDFAVMKKDEKTVAQKSEVRKLVENARVIICDEYHHYASKSANFILSKTYKADFTIGLSATPWRSYEDESILLERSIGPIIYAKSYSEMIDGGYLLPPYIYVYKMPRIKTEGKYYPAIYKTYITENTLRNKIIKKAAIALNKKGKTVAIHISKINHGEILQRLIPGSVLLTGKETTETRQDVLHKLEQGKILTVISTLLNEGVDLPSLSAVIIASGGKSSIDVFQRLRSITPDPNNPNKKYGIVIDFRDTARYLNKHSVERLSWYESEPSFKLFYRKLEIDGNKIKPIPVVK